MNETDRQILALLTENARMSAAEIARRLSLARSTVQARIDRLEASGAIAGYTIRRGIDDRPGIRATALLRIEPRSLPALLSLLRSLPEVELVRTTSGRFDVMVEVRAETADVLDALLDRIGAVKGVISSESLVHLSTRLDRRALPVR